MKNLLDNKAFKDFFLIQFLGAFNDNIFKNALIILITFKASILGGLPLEQMITASAGIFILPFFLFSALAGQLSDKYPKDKMVKIIKAIEIPIMILGSLSFYFENIYMLLISLFLLGTQSSFFGPVKYSILPEIMDKENLIEGNAFVEMGTFLAILLGTILGGYIISSEYLGVYALISTILFTSGLGFYFSRKMPKLKSSNVDLKINKNFITSTIDTIKLTKQDKGIFQSILGISWFWLIGAMILSIFPIYVKSTIGGDSNIVILFLAIFSIGIGIGSIICEKLSNKYLELGLVPFGSIGMTVFLIDLFMQNTVKSDELLTITNFLGQAGAYRIIFDLLMFSISSGFFIVPLYTLIQERSEDEIRGRLISGNNILNALFMVIGSLLLGVLFNNNFNSQEIFLMIGVGNALVSIYIYTVVPEFLLRFLAYMMSKFIYRIKVNGHYPNIPKKGAGIVTCNHVSFIDWFIIASSIKRPLRFVMYYKMMKIPFMKFIFKGAKVIPICSKKENEEVYNKAFKEISKALENGELVCIFPEGKITHDGELAEFKKGIEKILSKNPVPVIPMKLDGLWGSFFSRKYGKAFSKFSVIPQRYLSKISLTVGEPIEPELAKAEHIEEITKKLK